MILLFSRQVCAGWAAHTNMQLRLLQVLNLVPGGYTSLHIVISLIIELFMKIVRRLKQYVKLKAYTTCS